MTRVTCFISAVCSIAFVAGSPGTFTGVSRYFKKQNPAVRYVVVEPTNASILSGKRKTQGRLELHEKTVIARRRLPKNLQRPDGQRPSGALGGVTAR